MAHLPKRYPLRYSFADASDVRSAQKDHQLCLHVHAALYEHHHVRNAQATALQGNQRFAANAQLLAYKVSNGFRKSMAGSTKLNNT